MSRPKNPRPAPDLATLPGLTVASSIETMYQIKDLCRILNCGRRTIERMRSAGRFPKADLLIGKRKSPRWRPETIRRWIDGGGQCR